MSEPQNFPRPHHPGPRGDGSGALYGPPLSPPRNRSAEFARLLVELTPRVYVTPFLIGVNGLVFVAMALSGVSLTSPAIADLLLWGANFGPQTLAGEWWRLLTCMFIHIGILHLLLNMWALYAAGPLVERMVGNVGFLLMYLMAGLCGSLASVFWSPSAVGAGASGAVFGVFGCLLGLVLRGKGSIPTETLTHLRSSGISFLVINLVIGMMVPNIGTAAHLGGLAGGFLGGLILSQPFTPQARQGRILRNLMLAGLGACLVVGGFFGVAAWQSSLVNVQRELQQFGEVETNSNRAFDDAARRLGSKEISPAEFADRLEQDVLPDWRAARDRLSAVQRVHPSDQRRVELILEYMLLRQQGWELFVRGARQGSDQDMQAGLEKQRLAASILERMSQDAGK